MAFRFFNIMIKHFFLILIFVFGFSTPAFAQESVMLTSDSSGAVRVFGILENKHGLIVVVEENA